MKIYLASFFSSDIKRSADRFLSQAKSMQIYDKIKIFTFSDLNNDFKKYVQHLISKGKTKGYGYWVWQTYVHRVILSEMQDDDIYHWCDIGCHFNIYGKKRFLDYLKFLKNDDKGFLGFQYKPLENSNYKSLTFPEYIERDYTKPDLFKYFNLDINSEIALTPQVWGGSFLIKKNKISKIIFDEHYDITRNRFDLIDDDKEKYIIPPDMNYYKGHRHSQSVLSILAKSNHCPFISAYESEWAIDENNQRTYEHLKFYPIQARRDKKKNIFFRFFDRQKKNIRRLLKKNN